MTPAEAATEIERCAAIALDRWGVTVTPRVEWSLTESSAGRALSDSSVIYLHPGFAAQEGDDYRQTVIHEYAHCVAYRLAAGQPIEPHGVEWKALMLEFGAEPRPGHTYDTRRILAIHRLTLAGCTVHVSSKGAVIGVRPDVPHPKAIVECPDGAWRVDA